MKKLWMMLLAAASLAGCQKSEEVSISTGNTISLTAEMSQPTTSRTALVENEGVYSAIWKSGDKLTLFELANEAFSLYESNALGADAETASFTFDGVAAKEAESFRYVAGTNITSNCSINNIRMELPAEQAPATMNTFDGAADVLLSLPIDRATQPVSEALTFTTTRVSAVVKLAIKNLALAEGEQVESVSFACEQPISGKFQVGVKNLTADTYPIPFSWREEGYSISITLPEAQSGDFVTYFSTLPATLKAGESYTVTVKTNQTSITKEGTLAADLALTAGDITSVSVNMSDAATKSKVENLSEEYEYAIGYTDAEGKVWLLPRRAANRRPSGHEVGAAGTGAGDYGTYVDTYDLTKVSVAENGSLIGEVADAYRWKIAKTDDLYNFYYPNSDGKPIYLIAAANTEKSDGLAIKGYNDAGGFTAHYTDTYENTFSIVAKEGGYDIVFTPASGSASYKYVYFTGTQQYRIAKTSQAGVLNFYRIQPAPQKTIYPVITKAADITEGTYAFLAKKADGAYYALPNTKTVADGVNTCPTAYPLDVVSMTIENGLVTAAEIGDQYKWVITHRGETEQWDVRSALDMTCFLWQKPSGAGIAICTPDERNAVDTGFMPDWNFYDDAAKGMQAQTPNSAAHKTPRWLYVGANANMTTGYQWLGAKSATDAVVLVKISDSTEQIVTE